ncbi:cytochrome P450 [Phellopilus nigrolimitatus]|nr:cytochrome P450 [Phellopilus nigrolimitatus]
MEFGLLTGTLLTLVSALLYVSLTKKYGGKQLPPGPPPALIFGNALQLPKIRPWLQLTHWSHVYGNVVFMRIFRRPFVVLNSYEVVTDLLEKRSAIYSQRPIRNMALLSGFGKALLFQSNGESVRQARKLMHGEFSPRGVASHQALQQEEARQMAFRFLNGSLTLVENLRLTAAASLLKITYGYRIESVHDPLLGLAESVMNNLADVITPNKYLVDALPALKYFPEWFPGCGFIRTAKAWKAILEQFMELPFIAVINSMKEGAALPSFTSNLLESRLDSMNDAESDLLKWTAGGIYAAGSDTTISVLSSFFLAMLLHPDVQRKAHEELDRVVGQDCLPTFKDREQLPYIEAIIKEVLRWNPAAPLVSRSIAVDDEYKGFHIPANSVVTVNVWALTHDESVYPSASEFKPDRFLASANPGADIPPDPRLFIFGFGRRSEFTSPTALVYIVIATTLAAFRIVHETDANGKPIAPKVEYSTGAVSHPAPFKCRIEPRSRNAAKLVRDATENN